MSDHGHALRPEADLHAAVGIAFAPYVNRETTLNYHVAAKELCQTYLRMGNLTRGGGNNGDQNREAKFTHSFVRQCQSGCSFSHQ